MKKFGKHLRSGFTLVEIMIVIAIIGIIMAIGLFPYAEYMRQARLSNNVDTIAQEWVLAHKEVRNGIQFPQSFGSGNIRHASILFHFKKGENAIQKYLIAGTGSAIPNSLPNSGVHLAKEIPLDKGITIQDIENFSGNDLYYFIEAPFGEGTFYNSLGGTPLSDKNETIKIHYNAGDQTPRGKVFLRPYLQ